MDKTGGQTGRFSPPRNSFFPLTSPSSIPHKRKDISTIEMLATSHKSFVSKILPVSLYSPKILAVFIAQIFDSTRPGGGGGIPLLASELSLTRYLHGRNSIQGTPGGEMWRNVGTDGTFTRFSVGSDALRNRRTSRLSPRFPGTLKI